MDSDELIPYDFVQVMQHVNRTIIEYEKGENQIKKRIKQGIILGLVLIPTFFWIIF